MCCNCNAWRNTSIIYYTYIICLELILLSSLRIYNMSGAANAGILIPTITSKCHHQHLNYCRCIRPYAHFRVPPQASEIPCWDSAGILVPTTTSKCHHQHLKYCRYIRPSPISEYHHQHLKYHAEIVLVYSSLLPPQKCHHQHLNYCRYIRPYAHFRVPPQASEIPCWNCAGIYVPTPTSKYHHQHLKYCPPPAPPF